MKRLILTSMLTAAGLLAQATGAQSGSAPVAQPNAKASQTTKVKKHRRAAKKSVVAPNGVAKAPVKSAAKGHMKPAVSSAPVKK